jgi:hypothetical protein
MRDIRTAVVRVLKSEMNIWMAEFTQTAVAVPRGVRQGWITDDLLDQYPEKDYPAELSRTIAHKIGLPFDDDPIERTETGFLLNVTAEAIGSAVNVLRGLRLGDVAVTEQDGGQAWTFYQNNLDSHSITVEELRGYVTGMSWSAAATLMGEAHATAIGDANPATITGTGGFVTGWLRPGDHTETGWPVPPTQHGMCLAGVGTEVIGEPADLAELGERMAMRWQSPLIVALTELCSDLHVESERGFTQFPQSLRCHAVDQLAKVLAMAGSFDTATQIIAVHAEADDGDETHAHIRWQARLDEECTANGPVTYGSADASARYYVRNLLTGS